MFRECGHLAGFFPEPRRSLMDVLTMKEATLFVIRILLWPMTMDSSLPSFVYFL